MEILTKLREVLKEESWIRRTYRNIKNQYFLVRERKFMSVKLSQVYHNNCLPKAKPELLLITIAYNNPLVLHHQLRLLPKYLQDDFHHIVVNNSSKQAARKSIEILCKENKVGYVALPYNFYRNSNSHGLALNWAYEHIVKAIDPTYIGFLDHDIYPIRRHSLLPILEQQSFFGQREVKENIWYLWPGFCFFSTAFLKRKNIDFKPGTTEHISVDTGGLLYASFYKKTNTSAFLFPTAYYKNIREGNVIEADMVECIDINKQNYWLHSINAGYWKDVAPKEAVLDELLSQY